MRPLEICLLVLGVAASVCLISNRWSRICRILVALLVVDGLAQASLEGAHWQMIPAYFAVVVLLLAAWKLAGTTKAWVAASVCGLALLLLAASGAASYVFPMFRLPKPTGSYPVGTAILYFKDSSRIEDASPVAGQPRELMVQLWYPAEPGGGRLARYREPGETNFSSSYQTVLATNSRLNAPVAAAGAPFPVILFNHGWGSRRTNDTFLTEELASHGYVVASIDHTYNASVVAFPDGRQVRGNGSYLIGNPEGSTPDQVRAVWNKELAKQSADEEFVLDQLEAMNAKAGTPWYGRLNTRLAGAMGHSFGGSAATEICAQDARVRGSINMDGWFFGAIQARKANQDLMFMDTSGDHAGGVPDPSAPVSAALDASDYADLANSMRRYGGYIVTFDGAEHEDFTDQGLVSPLRRFSHAGTIPAPEMEKAVRAYVLAFFDKAMRGQDSSILHAGAQPFKQVSLTVFPEVKGAAEATQPAGAK
jgi:predicted dienelactone hydrolase